MAALDQLKRGSIQVQHAFKEVQGRVNHRHILTILITTAFAFGGIIEQSSSIALAPNNQAFVSAEEFALYVENTSYINRLCNKPDNDTQSEQHVVLSIPHIEIPLSISEEREAILREAFMWGCFISPLAASRIAVRVGAEQLFGYAIVGAGIAAVLVPAAWLTPAHVALRIFQGMCIGATWPTAHMMAVSWIKPKYISSFISCYTAVNLGYAIVGSLGTYLVSMFGRDALCYCICLSIFLWYFIWWRFVEVSLAFKEPNEKVRTTIPWRHFLASGPVWACGLSVLGSQWADATLMLAVLKYLKLVYGFQTSQNEILAVLPHVGHFCAAITFGIMVDHVRDSGVVSTTTARKLFVYISHFIPAALIFVLGYTGCDPSAPAAMYTAALTLTAATPAGAYASAVDLAPEYAGTIFGLCTTMGAAGLLAANYVVREGLHGSFAGWWRLVFGVTSAELFITACVFLSKGRGCAQSWSSHYKPKEVHVEDTKIPKYSITLVRNSLPTYIPARRSNSLTPAETTLITKYARRQSYNAQLQLERPEHFTIH